MRAFKIFIIVACLGFAAMVTEAFITANDFRSGKNTKTAPAGKGFAVVELFTSEGCSSCPPADALVARIQKESTDKPIYILAFHVDYWNRLGWKDVFSNAEYSARQNQYARWLKLSSVYTPQSIVNGRTEFVGSEENSLRSAINTGLASAAKADITLTNLKFENEKAIVKYHTEGTTADDVLMIALIEKNATTKVQRGENGGRTLSHVQIVTQLKSVALKNNTNGTESITLPLSFDPQKFELIGFVQSKVNGEISGATKAEFASDLKAYHAN